MSFPSTYTLVAHREPSVLFTASTTLEVSCFAAVLASTSSVKTCMESPPLSVKGHHEDFKGKTFGAYGTKLGTNILHNLQEDSPSLSVRNRWHIPAAVHGLPLIRLYPPVFQVYFQCFQALILHIVCGIRNTRLKTFIQNAFSPEHPW